MSPDGLKSIRPRASRSGADASSPSRERSHARSSLSTKRAVAAVPAGFRQAISWKRTLLLPGHEPVV